MKYDYLDDKNHRVSDRSDWIELSEIKDDFKSKIGVFMLSDDENEVLYVSQLNKLFNAIKTENTIDCTRVKILFTASLADKFSLLFYLINKYKPMYNFRSKVDLF